MLLFIMISPIWTCAIAFIFQYLQSASAGPAAYIFYKNGKCNNYNTTITGTMVLAYNDERLSGRGRVHKHYYGNCKYFSGGFYDFEYEEDTFEILNGYCIECNGIVGCTNIKNDCSGFQSEVPENIYTLSSFENEEQDSNSTDYYGDDYDGDVYATADLVDYHVYKAIQGSQGYQANSLYQFAAVICAMTLLAFFAKKVAGNMESQIDSSKFLQEGEGYNSHVMVEQDISAARNGVAA